MTGLWLAVLRVALGLTFAVSGALKLMRSSQEFLSVILGYKILSGEPARLLSIFLPWTEFLGGVFLTLGLWTETAAAALWVLNSVFVLALGSALARGVTLKDCGCFGDRFSLPPWAVFLLDLGFWAAFWALWRSKSRSFGLDNAFQK